MIFLICSLGLVAATFLIVRPATAEGVRVSPSGLDRTGLVLAATFMTASVTIFSFAPAVALLTALLLRELGEVAGHWITGHDLPRMRFLPLPGAAPIADHAPRSDLDACFIALMGPAVSLAPMVAAFALGNALEDSVPATAYALRLFALAIGALNFITLLPLLPFTGGRVLQMTLAPHFPQLGPLPVSALTAALIGMSWTMGSALLFLLAMSGGIALSMGHDRLPVRRRLTRHQALLAATAYFAMLSAFFLVGWWVVDLVPLPL